MKKIVTHNGRYHADDVFAVAALKILLGDEEVEIVRTRDPELIRQGDFVVDVGLVNDPDKDLFDHHQSGVKPRENGVPYAAIGLVWKKYGEQLCGSQSGADRIDKILVQPIDAADNGFGDICPVHADVYPYTIQDTINAFVTTWKEENNFDQEFLMLVDFAVRVLEREIKKSQDKEEGNKKIEEVYNNAEDKRILVLDKPYSWHEFADENEEIIYVVVPAKAENGAWALEAARKDPNKFGNRKDLPKSWVGLPDGELAEVTGVPDAFFAHKARFTARAHSKEGAIALARIALED